MSPLVLAAALLLHDSGQALGPPGLTATLLVPLDGGAAYAFDVSPEGQPVLARNDLFVPIVDRDGRPSEPFRVAGVQVESVAFTTEGALLVVSGKRLGVVTKEGLRPLVELPEPKMQLAAAGPREVWVWSARDLYRLRAGGTLEHVLQVPEVIGAVASDGKRTVVAVGHALLELAEEGPRLLASAPAPVTSLALAPGGALVCASARGLGWVSGGRWFPFARGGGATVRVRGTALMVLWPDEGLVRLWPVGAFDVWAQHLEQAPEFK